MSFFSLSISEDTASFSDFSLSALPSTSRKRASFSCKAVVPPSLTYLKKKNPELTIHRIKLESRHSMKIQITSLIVIEVGTSLPFAGKMLFPVWGENDCTTPPPPPHTHTHTPNHSPIRCT